jgi:hypothetical protein
VQDKYNLISFSRIKTYSLKKRKSKTSLSNLARPFEAGSFRDFLESLPQNLAVTDLKKVVDSVVRARQRNRPVILGMGAHPIKVGLSPVIINLMQRGIITAVAMNGACIIHDFELSLIGHTSEDVDSALCKGTFGMAKETGEELNIAIKEGVSKGEGVGKAVGDYIISKRFPYGQFSILAGASRLAIPATVHVALGTDIIHMHPHADGAMIGEGSMRDFRLFCSIVSQLKDGVYINLGSAVIMPEVFLKAIAISRNLRRSLKGLTTVNMDFIQHYRPRENVLRRPVLSDGKSYALTGHHEIMFPLLAAAIIEGLKKGEKVEE